jgi:hypothetical protein
MQLITPHIPLGISLSEGLEILSSVSSDIEKHVEEKEIFYRIGSENWACGFYEKGGIIHSSWYDDTSGRDSQEGINEKVSLYLARYGNINEWESGLNNSWIQFFTNKKSGVGMAYGLHKDVLRFNRFD